MKWGKGVLVIFGALIITALGIDAADTLTGSKGTLLSQVITTNAGVCPLGMGEVTGVQGVTCVDLYEVSAGDGCPNKSPEQMIGTQQNIAAKECAAIAQKDAVPWRFITRDQAMQMCARSGKRLPTSAEWYGLSLGLVQPEKVCNVHKNTITPSGSHTECVSPHGAYDLVGNAWEWVSDDVIGGMHNTNKLPATGYVAQVDAGGMATVVQDTPLDTFENDYFWSREDGAYGIIRGGYYDSGTDGGIYTVHADTPPTSASIGIGFRCVK